MDDSQKRDPSEAAIRMPGALLIEETLGPGESKPLVLQIPPDYDFLLERITCRSDGPVLLKIDVAPPPEPTCAASRPTQAFSVALETEYPAHLAALVGEGLEEWTQKNADLTQRAWAGDDPAFFELIGRDPRVVGSELTVAKVVSWRTELEGFAKYLNLKGSRLFPLTRLEEARAKMEAAKNLRRLGQVHIAFFDQRGKKPLPPPGVVKGLYYAFLCLFAGLKQEFQSRVTRDGPQKARQDLLALVKALRGLQVQPDSSFFIYITWGVRLLDQLRVGETRGLTEDTVPNVVGPGSSKPSEVALDLTA